MGCSIDCVGECLDNEMVFGPGGSDAPVPTSDAAKKPIISNAFAATSPRSRSHGNQSVRAVTTHLDPTGSTASNGAGFERPSRGRSPGANDRANVGAATSNAIAGARGENAVGSDA